VQFADDSVADSVVASGEASDPAAPVEAEVPADQGEAEDPVEVTAEPGSDTPRVVSAPVAAPAPVDEVAAATAAEVPAATAEPEVAAEDVSVNAAPIEVVSAGLAPASAVQPTGVVPKPTLSVSAKSVLYTQAVVFTAKWKSPWAATKKPQLALQYKLKKKWVNYRVLTIPAGSTTVKTTVYARMNLEWRVVPKVLAVPKNAKRPGSNSVKITVKKPAVTKPVLEGPQVFPGKANVTFTAKWNNPYKSFKPSNLSLQYVSGGKWKTLTAISIPKGKTSAKVTVFVNYTNDWRLVPTAASVPTSVARPASDVLTTVTEADNVAPELSAPKTYVSGAQVTFTAKWKNPYDFAHPTKLELQYKSNGTWKKQGTITIANGKTSGKASWNIKYTNDWRLVPTTDTVQKGAKRLSSETLTTYALMDIPAPVLEAPEYFVGGTEVTFKATWKNSYASTYPSKLELQYLSSGTWKTKETITIPKGKTSASIKFAVNYTNDWRLVPTKDSLPDYEYSTRPVSITVTTTAVEAGYEPIAKPNPTESIAMKVASFNVGCYKCVTSTLPSWESRRDAVVSRIKEQAPDVLGVQELAQTVMTGTSTPQYVDLMNRLGDPYAITTCGTSRSPQCAAYASRNETHIIYNTNNIEVVEAGFVQLPNQSGAGVNRHMSWAVLKQKQTGKVFLVGNAHYKVGSQYATLRYKQAMRALEALKEHGLGNMPTIMLGDWNSNKNASDGNKVYTVMTAAGLLDPLGNAPKSTKPVDDFVEKRIRTNYNTYNGYSRTPPYSSKYANGTHIDYILVTEMRVSEFEVVLKLDANNKVAGAIPSDHNMIRANVWIP
jgi:endonuclease/exonuclease/phosphatase family metal-dependent hydrolase